MIESDQRFTPQHVLDVVREFDRIVLDPCTVESNPVGAHLAIIPPNGCGLSICWSGLIADAADHIGVTFVNHPYSRGHAQKWAEKCVTEWERNSVEIITLSIADTSTRACRFMLERATAAAFWKKRIRFAGDASAKFPNVSFYLGERQGRFKRVFEPHATVLVLR